MLPRIKKDCPFYHFGINQNITAGPWVVAKKCSSLVSINCLDDQQHSAAVGVWAAEDNPAFVEQAVHEFGMFIPKRLLAAGQSSHPCRAWVSKDEKERVAHIDQTQVVRMARPSSRALACRWMTPPALVRRVIITSQSLFSSYFVP